MTCRRSVKFIEKMLLLFIYLVTVRPTTCSLTGWRMKNDLGSNRANTQLANRTLTRIRVLVPKKKLISEGQGGIPGDHGGTF